MAEIGKMPAFKHEYAFDPTYGYSLERLLAVGAPPEPAGFGGFWQARFERTCAVDPQPAVSARRADHRHFLVHDLHYVSTDGVLIGGWLLTPRLGVATTGAGALAGDGPTIPMTSRDGCE